MGIKINYRKSGQKRNCNFAYSYHHCHRREFSNIRQTAVVSVPDKPPRKVLLQNFPKNMCRGEVGLALCHSN